MLLCTVPTLAVLLDSHLLCLLKLKMDLQVSYYILMFETISETLLYAVYPMDFVGVTEVVMFDSCDVKSCINITIIDDLIPEIVESFSITLEEASGHDDRITLEPTNAVIRINDDDGMIELNDHPLYSIF